MPWPIVSRVSISRFRRIRMPASTVPSDRLAPLNTAEADPSRGIVLYWQVMQRRTRYNWALEHAVELARAWGRPLVVLEALRAGYP